MLFPDFLRNHQGGKTEGKRKRLELVDGFTFSPQAINLQPIFNKKGK